MAPYAASQSVTPLRVVTQRISNTPTKQLPHIAPILATNIAESKKLFAVPQNGTQSKDDSENTTVVHKLKTQLSALLQDKQPQARYAAVILIKATVEVGGWNVLQGTASWVRGIIGIIGRPDSLSTKKLCITTLTRLFLLTHEHQSLVREITTPSLAGFTSVCLNLAQGLGMQDSLLLVILKSLSELITLHPTSFRPFVPQLQRLVLSLIAPTPSDLSSEDDRSPVSTPLSNDARRLFVLLHVCGPKNTAGEEWARSLENTLAATQRTADQVFRALVEDWRPRLGKADVIQPILASGVIGDKNPEPLSLRSWTGIYAGIERLDGLLRTVQSFLATMTSVPVVFPVTNIVNLLDRVLSALPPSSSRDSRYRPEIGKDEREGLIVGLPKLHVSAMRVLSLMVSRMSSGFAPLSNTALEQAIWVFENEQEVDDVRMTTYKLLSQILSAFGLSLSKSNSVSLSRCITSACADLLPADENPTQNGLASAPNSKNSSGSDATTTNADSYLKSVGTRTKVLSAQPAVEAAAQELIQLALTKLPHGFLSGGIRNEIDRTAILTDYKATMLASVMNAGASKKGQKTGASILPILARAYPDALEVETVLRPQMPLVRYRQNQEDMAMSDEDDGLNNQEDRLSENRNGIQPNGFGFDGDRNEPSSHAESEHGVLHTSIRSQEHSNTAKATEQLLITQSAPTGQPEPKSTLLYTSNKRDREEDLSSTVQTGGSEVETLGSEGLMEMAALSKRARLAHDQPQSEHEAQEIPHALLEKETQVLGTAVGESSVSEVVGATSAQINVGQEDSDESDFEMPTLHLEPSSDEEGDEEDGDENDN